MPPTCKICRHPKRADIDRELVAGQPYRGIAKRYGAPEQAVLRHKGSHLPKALQVAQEAKLEAQGASLLEQVEELKANATRLGKKAEAKDDLRTALAAIRELTRLVELMAKISGELHENQATQLVLSPEWASLRTRLLEVLDAYPEARSAVMGVLGAH